MPKAIDLGVKIKDLPLGKLTGAAQDTVELALARSIREMESNTGQTVNTMNVRNFVVSQNEKHEFVHPTKVDALASNVQQAYTYVAAQEPLAISRAGFKSYQAEGIVKTIDDAVQQLGAVLSGKGRSPQQA